MEAKQILNARIEDLIFEGRNKAYGAYDIRQKYGKNVGIATAIAISLLVLALLTPMIIDRLTPEEEVMVMPDKVVTVNELADAPPLDETKPPPPPLDIPEPPKVIQFVPPVLTTEIVEEDPPTIEEIKTTQTSSTSNEGTEINFEPAPEEVKVIEQPKEDNTIYEFADEQPSFKGDYQSYLKDHIQYPPQAYENNIQGTVYLEVVVDKDGSIKDVKVKKDIGGGCGKEAERVVRQMPAWEPGKQNGRAVPVRVTIPVKFVLQ